LNSLETGGRGDHGVGNFLGVLIYVLLVVVRTKWQLVKKFEYVVGI
jgi:hypothetical protein